MERDGPRLATIAAMVAKTVVMTHASVCGPTIPPAGGTAALPRLPGELGPPAPSELAVWTADATGMVAERRGAGYAAPFSPGSECDGSARYSMTVADRRLAWRICRPSSTANRAPWRWVVDARVLTPDELAGLVLALRGVWRSPRGSCGADKAPHTLSVTTPAGTTLYKDSFQACQGTGNWVDFIDPVFRTLDRLVK